MKWLCHKRSVSRRRVGMTGVLAVVFLSCFGWVAETPACAIPVFRYALEHWPATSCRMVVFHRGALTPAQRVQLNALGQSNLFEVETCDLSAPTNRLSYASGVPTRMIWDKLPNHPALPVVTLSCWGGREYDSQSVLSWPLNQETVDTLLKKIPLHLEVARRLLAGDSAVWVLLTSPNASRNAAARKMLTSTLREMEQALKLPHEVDPKDSTYDMSMSTNVPLRVRFSMLEIPGSGLEADLMRSALRTISTNAITVSEPVAIPVFGRGLALDAFSGPTLDAEIVSTVCGFLCGSCSCNLKETRIGVNLFMPVDWDAVVLQSQPLAEVLPPLVVPAGTGSTVQAAPPRQAPAPVAEKKHDDAPRTGFSRSLWALLGGGLLIVVAGTLSVLRGQGKK